jgi:hypothetical protein
MVSLRITAFSTANGYPRRMSLLSVARRSHLRAPCTSTSTKFVFRHNRRRTPMAAFQTLLGLGTLHPPTTYEQITTHAA